jgi:hypothetical protein
MFFCVSLHSDDMPFAMACVLEEVDCVSSPFSSLVVQPSLGSIKYSGIQIKRTGLLLLVVFSVLIISHDARIKGRKPWCLLRMS